MEWAPQINTLTLFDITGEPAIQGQDPPECPICSLGLYDPQLFPSEITTCHHRFHRDCLRNQWCNNNADNTLEACRCPNCEQIFNCDTQLQDLTPQVNARLQELQQPAVVEAQGLAAAVPQVQQIPANNLQTYTRQNYLIDRATRRFTDCITQILRDIPPPVLPAYLNDIPNHNQNRLLNDQCNRARMEYFRYFLRFIQETIYSYKYSQYYATFLGEIRNILNNINVRLQDNDFMRGLIQNPNGIFYNYRNARPNSFGMTSGILLQFLIACYNDADPDANNVIFRIPNGANVFDSIFIRSEVRQFIDESCGRFIYSMTTSTDPNVGGNQINCVNVIPIRWDGNAPYINPDFQFFQRYIQCFLDFLTALLEVNYNQAFQQQGGKRSNSSKRSRGKRSNRSKRSRGKRSNSSKRSLRKTRKLRRNEKVRKNLKRGKK
jgi:hypothetical protein